MAASSTAQGRDTEDREDTDDIENKENNLSTSGKGERSAYKVAAENTNDYDEISTVI